MLAKLNLSYTPVRAPFDGRIGRHLVNPGNLVGPPGQRRRWRKSTARSAVCLFHINEGDLLKSRSRYKDTACPAKPLGPRKLPCYFELVNETGFPHQGRWISPRSQWHQLPAPCSCAESFPIDGTVSAGSLRSRSRAAAGTARSTVGSGRRHQLRSTGRISPGSRCQKCRRAPQREVGLSGRQHDGDRRRASSPTIWSSSPG